MFLAHAAALRSGQLARQVGAVVVSVDREVVSTGANDVPRFGGGLWPVQDGKPDYRDHHPHIAGDSNDRAIEGLIASIIEKARRSSASLAEKKFTKELMESEIADLTEYGRAVHAELEARRGCA